MTDLGTSTAVCVYGQPVQLKTEPPKRDELVWVFRQAAKPGPSVLTLLVFADGWKPERDQ